MPLIRSPILTGKWVLVCWAIVPFVAITTSHLICPTANVSFMNISAISMLTYALLVQYHPEAGGPRWLVDFPCIIALYCVVDTLGTFLEGNAGEGFQIWRIVCFLLSGHDESVAAVHSIVHRDGH